MHNPININDAKEVIKLNPGISRKGIGSHYKCNTSKVSRLIKQLKDDGFLFVQMKGNDAFYFDNKYAEARNLERKIVIEGKSTNWYRQRAKARAEKKALKLKRKTRWDQHLWLCKLWPVRGLAVNP